MTPRAMAALLAAGLAAGACAASAPAPAPDEPEAPTHAWGPAVSGVGRARARVRSRWVQGETLEARLELEVDSKRFPRVDLQLRREGADRAVVVKALDPHRNMSPVPPRPEEEGSSRDLLFPLGEAFEHLPPGLYAGRLVGHDGRHAVETGEFPVEILEARLLEETFRVPRRLRLLPAADPAFDAEVSYGAEDAETLRVAVHEGLTVGTSILRNEGGPAGADMATLSSAPPAPDSPNPVDWILRGHEGPFAATYRIVVFESGQSPEHFWTPEQPGVGYRVLWERTFEVRATAEELEALRKR